MVKSLRPKQFGFVLTILFFGFIIPRVMGADVSNWSYNELHQTAMEMQGDGNYKGALKFFNLAIHAQPKNPEGYLNRGAVFELLHDKKSAVADEKMAIELAKGNTKDDIDIRSLAHQNLAGIYLNHHEADAAEREARTSIEINPNDPNAQEHLAKLLVTIGKSEEALTYLEKARQGYERWKDSVSTARVKAKISQLQGK